MRLAAGGFTLMELMISGAIGSVIGLVALGAMAEGTHLFKTNSTEMIGRDEGSRAIRRITADIQGGLATQIFPDYLGTAGAETQVGSCVVVQRPAGGSVAYYRYAPNTDLNSGGIYATLNASALPNPLTDKIIVRSARELEFRRDVNGAIRVGFDIGTAGYPTRVTGGKEADRVRFSTSSLPRN